MLRLSIIMLECFKIVVELEFLDSKPQRQDVIMHEYFRLPEKNVWIHLLSNI